MKLVLIKTSLDNSEQYLRCYNIHQNKTVFFPNT